MVSESAPEVYCYVSVVSESVLAVFCYGCMVFVIAIIMVSESVPAVFVMAIWFQRVCLQFVVMAIMVSESVPAFPPPPPPWLCGVREDAQLLQQLQVDEFAVTVVESENA